MARKKNDTVDAPEIPAFEISASPTGLVRKRDRKPNPLAEAVLSTLDTGEALMVAVDTPEQAKDAANMVRRAQKEAGEDGNHFGVRIDTREPGHSLNTTGRYEVHFLATRNKRSRRYTVDQIREWAIGMGYGDDVLYPRVHPDVREAFKIAFEGESVSA